MKKIKLLIIPILLLLVCGCGKVTKETSELDKNNVSYYMQDEEGYYIAIDRKSCVEYIQYSVGYKGGISPRYNADGTLKLNKECLNEKDN